MALLELKTKYFENCHILHEVNLNGAIWILWKL